MIKFFLALCKSEAILIAAEHKHVLWITWFAHKMIMFGILNVQVWFMKTVILHLLIELTFKCILVCNRQNDNTVGSKELSTSEYSQNNTFLSASLQISWSSETQSRISASRTRGLFFLCSSRGRVV